MFAQENSSPDNPSLTAYKVALMRAVHQVLDDPIVFEDPLALSIAGIRRDSDIHSLQRKYGSRIQKYLRAMVVARSRFVEDELSGAIKRGIRQYVILGAGLDTYPYRNPDSSAGLKIFEVDHPATQEWKRRQLDAAELPVPEILTFVPVDFEIQSLALQLAEAGFRADEPSFFSWLGVVVYLSRGSMMETMKYIASGTAAGTTIVFDYVVPPSSQGILRRLIFRRLTRKVVGYGEPWQTFYDPDSLVDDLKALGFSRVHDVGSEELNAMYFSSRADKLKAGSSGHLIKAQL